VKRTIIGISLTFLFASMTYAADKAVVLAATATSSSSDSAPVTCLLDPNCTGHWSPGSKDSGTDEGIYIQFENPISASHIKLSASTLGKLVVYINGKTSGPDGRYYIASGRANYYVAYGWGNALPIPERIKSIFIKIDSGDLRVNISRIQFLSSKLPAGELEAETLDVAIPLVLPKLISASISASSILSPETAYQPANLVDSKYDMAWSTDGKKTAGKGESFTVTFNAKQTLAGMLLWNGYQRSEEHFKANGRVLQMEARSDAGDVEQVTIKDMMGPQRVVFKKPFKDIKSLSFKIKDIKAGDKYKDVLISELRFIGNNNELILPIVAAKATSVPNFLQPLIGRSFSAILHQPVTQKEIQGDYFILSPKCDNSRIRIRNDGSYVIYKGYDYSSKDADASVEATVFEGNWEPKDNLIRIFGRNYKTALETSEYLKGALKAPRTNIFQSELTIKPYSTLTAKEKAKLFEYLWSKKRGPADRSQRMFWVVGIDEHACSGEINPQGNNAECVIEGTSYSDLVKKLDDFLLGPNPYWISSSILTDLLLPTDSVQQCQASPFPG